MELIRVESINITNFRSFGVGEYLHFPTLSNEVLVVGMNQTKEGANSNGAGKSSIFYALTWCLFGRWMPKGSVKLAADDMIRNGQDDCCVELVLHYKNKRIIVQRSRGSDRGLLVEVDGSQLGLTATQAQDQLLQLLDINPKSEYVEDFCASVLLTSNSIRAFAGPGMTSSQRMTMLSRFLNLQVLDRAKGIAGNKRKAAQDKFRENEAVIEVLQKDIDALDDLEPEEIVKSWEQELAGLEADEVRANEQIAQMEKGKALMAKGQELERQAIEIIESTDAQKSILEERLKDIHSELQGLDILQDKMKNASEGLTTFVDSRANIKALQEELSGVKGDLSQSRVKIEAEINTLESQQKSVMECPSCGTSLMYLNQRLSIINLELLQDQVSILGSKRDNILQVLKEVEAEILKAASQYRTVEELAAKLDKELQEIEIMKVQIARGPELLEKLKSAEATIGTIDVKKEQNLADLKKEIRAYEQTVAEFQAHKLVDTVFNKSIFEIRNEIKALRNRIADLKAKRASLASKKAQHRGYVKRTKPLADEFEKYNFWERGFPTIRRWMIEQYLPMMEQKVNDFLSQIMADFSVRIQTMRAKASGDEMIPEFNISIITPDGHESPISTLSGGEERRTSLAIGLAFRALGLEQGYMPFDLILIDEIVDTLDETGIEYFFEWLPKIPGRKIIISHDTSLKSRFNSVITVVNEHGISYLETNEAYGTDHPIATGSF